MTKGIQQSEKWICLTTCRIQGTTVVFFPGAVPIPLPSNTQVDWHEGFSRVGEVMRTGSRIIQLTGAHLIWGGQFCNGELTNSVVWEQEGPEALLVCGCGHGSNKHAWLKLCVCAWHRPRRAQASQTLLVNPEVISVWRGDVKRLSRKYKLEKTPSSLRF